MIDQELKVKAFHEALKGIAKVSGTFEEFTTLANELITSTWMTNDEYRRALSVVGVELE